MTIDEIEKIVKLIDSTNDDATRVILRRLLTSAIQQKSDQEVLDSSYPDGDGYWTGEGNH